MAKMTQLPITYYPVSTHHPCHLLLVQLLSEDDQPVAQLLLHLSQPPLLRLQQGLSSFFLYFVQFVRICFKMFSSCELVNVLHLLLFLSLTVPICLSQAVTKL